MSSFENSAMDEVYEFTRCVRADGTAYGTSGKCRKGTEQAKTGVKEDPDYGKINTRYIATVDIEGYLKRGGEERIDALMKWTNKFAPTKFFVGWFKKAPIGEKGPSGVQKYQLWLAPEEDNKDWKPVRGLKKLPLSTTAKDIDKWLKAAPPGLLSFD